MAEMRRYRVNRRSTSSLVLSGATVKTSVVRTLNDFPRYGLILECPPLGNLRESFVIEFTDEEARQLFEGIPHEAVQGVVPAAETSAMGELLPDAQQAESA